MSLAAFISTDLRLAASIGHAQASGSILAVTTISEKPRSASFEIS